MPEASWKFAVLVDRKLGDAWLRNRHKRWAREAFRRLRADLPKPGSIVLRFLKTAQSYQQVLSEFREAYDRASENRHRSGALISKDPGGSMGGAL